MYWTGRNRSDVVIPPRFGVQFEDLKLTPSQVCFLYCFISTCGHIRRASEAARLNRTTHSWWLSCSPNKDNYATAFERVKPIAAQALLDKAIERAAHGVEEPVFYKGEVCGFVQKYSDNLMIRLLEGEMPEKYRNRTDVKMGNTAGEVFKLDPGREVLTDQKLAALIELGQKAVDAAKAAAVIPPSTSIPKPT